ncbi:hypothetical protein [uncultured Roseovarius sp.]|uniref:hypothetical protein n=1 Tax=uncultured Roseovarius sp. TaxID=293344 RepID=UPI002609E893|nr:hypothetical protein [uncultured Roseovarius sp.]
MRKLLILLLVTAATIYVMPGIFTARQLANEHYEKAAQLITTAKEDRKSSIDFSELTHLRQLPPTILEIEDLYSLNLDGTEIASLEIVAQLPALARLSIRETPVTDLTPLARLKNLHSLDIGKSRVRNLEPLAQIEYLATLDIGTTEILSLEPLTRAKFLLWVNLHRSYAMDGSKQHYDRLHQLVPEVYNGSAFKQNYVPGQLYLITTRLNRLATDLYLPEPFPRS